MSEINNTIQPVNNIEDFKWTTPWTAIFETTLRDFDFDEEYFKIVQIGSNDGFFFDPLFFTLRNLGWKTEILLVEAQSDLMPTLQNTYNFHQKATFANEVVSDGANKDFYSFKPEYYQYYNAKLQEQGYFIGADIQDYMSPSGVASLHREVILKHYNEFFDNKDLSFEDVINVENMPTITLENLLSKYEFSSDIDLLCMNVQGEEINILENSNWDLIKPNMIFFEYAHNTKEEQKRIKKLLLAKGYKLEELTWVRQELLAVKKDQEALDV